MLTRKVGKIVFFSPKTVMILAMKSVSHTRRQFLKTSIAAGAAVAGPQIVAAETLGKIGRAHV